MYYYNDFFSFHIFGFIFMFLFWGLIIYGVITLLRRNELRNNDRSLDILKERYAKGEITKEQFETVRKDLR